MQFDRIKLPTYTEKMYSGKPWVKYGDNNLFPIFLQEMANKSALHGAIISSKVDYSFANGLELKDGNFSNRLFFNHPNSFEDLNAIYKKCLYDFILYGGFALNVIWAQDGSTVSELYHVDFSKIRCGKKNERDVVTDYFYCDDWANVARVGYKPIKAFNLNERVGSQLLVVKEYRPSTFYYPLPAYIGALNYIAIDTEISNYHLSHLLNGMTPNVLINFTNGIPTEEERRNIKQQFINEYTGADNAGKFILTFNEDSTRIPQIQTLSADNLDEQFIQLQSTVMENILAGHKIVSPMLVGIKTEGQLGGATELANAYKIYYETVIKNIQNVVIGGLNDVLRQTSDFDGAELTPTIPQIQFQ